MIEMKSTVEALKNAGNNFATTQFVVATAVSAATLVLPSARGAAVVAKVGPKVFWATFMAVSLVSEHHRRKKELENAEYWDSLKEQVAPEEESDSA